MTATATADPSGPGPLFSGKDAKANQRADKLFAGAASGSGVIIVALITLIGVFLLWQSLPALLENNANFLFSSDFTVSSAKDLSFGIKDLLLVTVLSSAFALVIAMPLAMGIALFLTHYAPVPLRRPFSYVIDTLAAVPSVVFGLWGFKEFGPMAGPVGEWVERNLGWFPLFADGNVDSISGSIFVAGIVLSIMILPIITSVTREVFRQTPRAHIEGALALGATKWEVVRTTVLPFGKSGYIAACMLGLGRALGETVAVLIILSATRSDSGFSLFDGGFTFATKIASGAGEFGNPITTGAFIAAGLVLFVLTFVVNAVARGIAKGKAHA